jgi:hypothetical protein
MLPATSRKTTVLTSGKAAFCFLTVVLLILPLFAADKKKDEDTLSKANLLLQDMLNSKDISVNRSSQNFGLCYTG